jgi:hypothetical protein
MNDEVYHVGIIGSFIPEGFHIAAENILFARKGYGPVTVIAWRGEGYAETDTETCHFCRHAIFMPGKTFPTGTRTS